MQRKNQATIAIAVFLIPGLLYYIVLVLMPISQAFVLSTYRWTSLRSRVFVGFDNYLSVFQNEIFWKSMRNSGIFMLMTTVVQVVLGFAVGYFLYMQLKFYRFFKTVYFVPVVLNTVAVGFIWGYIYSPAFGLLKPFLEAFGLGQYYFPPLASPSTALISVILAQIWNTLGIQIMMFNAGFMNMPQDVMEMASIEGASGFKLIWYMVIPMAWEITKTVIVLQIIAGLRVFDLVFVMTNGGPNHATELLPLHMFATAFENFNIGNGSVVAVVIFVLAMSLTLGLRKLMHREALQY